MMETLRRVLALLEKKRGSTPTSDDATGVPSYIRLDFLDGEAVHNVYWSSEGCIVKNDNIRGWVEIDSPAKEVYDSCATCGNCGKSVAVWSYSPRLGDGNILHCDSCPNQIHVSWNLSDELTREVWPKTDTAEEALEHICRHLRPCRCGGRFRSGLDPFCPFCHTRLDADLDRHFGVIFPTESFMEYWVSDGGA